MDEQAHDDHRPWQYDFAVKFGAIALVGIYLVWWITSALDSRISAILAGQQAGVQNQQMMTKELLTLRQALDEQTNLLRRELDQHMRMLEVIRYTQYQTCLNSLGPGRDVSRCLGGPQQAHQPREPE